MRKFKKKPDRPGYRDEKYKKLKAQVFKRDRGMCRMPKCKKRGNQLHHIKKWADYPELRYSIGNCILLCKVCHKRTFGKEEQFAPLFNKLIRPPVDVDLIRLKYGFDEPSEVEPFPNS